MEDHFIVREILRDILELAGYSVSLAVNGAEAVERCREPPAIPIIALSALVTSGVDPELRAAGFCAFEGKPYTVRQILDLVERHLTSGIERLEGASCGGPSYPANHLQREP